LLDVYNRALLAYIDIDEAGVKGAHVIEQAARFVRAVGSTWVAIVLDLLHARVLGRTGDRARARALAERVEREAKEHGHMRTSGDATKLIAEIDDATRPSR
jgi:hypothetical protein